MKETFTVSEKELPELAEKVIQTLSRGYEGGARVVLLEGDLGAGKTTFTKALGQALGIQAEDIFSPTFILKKEHKGEHVLFSRLVHIDAYRFEHEDEAKVLKLHEDLEKNGTLIVIEWPSQMGWRDGDITIRFTVLDEETRNIEIEYASSHA
ncbi:MAG: hypothetical protein RLZZ308_674 [Candidatus Parcubacteria bacterium]|jgi:tRNA threonylcarbamoyladenosine biosynthesis protein TsaE